MKTAIDFLRSLRKKPYLFQRQAFGKQLQWSDLPLCDFGAYDDLEMSVDLHIEVQTELSLRNHYADIIHEKGVGFSATPVQIVRETLVSKEICGNVWKDPIQENALHGIVTGPKNKRKRESMRDTFVVLVKPKSPSEVFST